MIFCMCCLFVFWREWEVKVGGGGVTLSEIMQVCSFEQEITLSLISGVYIQVMNRR